MTREVLRNAAREGQQKLAGAKARPEDHATATAPARKSKEEPEKKQPRAHFCHATGESTQSLSVAESRQHRVHPGAQSSERGRRRPRGGMLRTKWTGQARCRRRAHPSPFCVPASRGGLKLPNVGTERVAAPSQCHKGCRPAGPPPVARQGS